jgi:hypothetical protein
MKNKKIKVWMWATVGAIALLIVFVVLNWESFSAGFREGSILAQ